MHDLVLKTGVVATLAVRRYGRATADMFKVDGNR